MRIAILGAGLSGLSVAWHLLANTACQVVLYDPKGIGGGASGIAAGLMHPYPGEQGRRSKFASEGMQATSTLIEEIQKQRGAQIVISQGALRYVQNEEQKAMFLSHVDKYGDVKPHGENCFWIEGALTIDCPLYLQELWLALSLKGAELIRKEVLDLSELEEFDQIIIAAGAGIKKFLEADHLAVSVLKGQLLTCRAPSGVAMPFLSSVCKGYIALSHDPSICHLGSTYEREDLSETPNVDLARDTLFEKISFFFPQVGQLEILDCKAALRVVRRGHYLPIVGKLRDNRWVFSALGSRGLLYHAYFGKRLAEAILDKSSSSLSNNQFVS